MDMKSGDIIVNVTTVVTSLHILNFHTEKIVNSYIIFSTVSDDSLYIIEVNLVKVLLWKFYSDHNNYLKFSYLLWVK